ncbi:MAG: rhodanese-like domain-containing protein [Bacteroidales bacterium]|nr:rhodanese-like domain-containing protein [Bacteroidales bacterium]
MKFVSALKLNELISREPDIQIVDIREKEEFDIAHIKGSTNVPRLEIEQNTDKFSRDKSIAIICRFGTKSSGVARKFIEAGFPAHKVYILDEGILSWAIEVDPSMPAHLL